MHNSFNILLKTYLSIIDLISVASDFCERSNIIDISYVLSKKYILEEEISCRSAKFNLKIQGNTPLHHAV